MVSRDVTDRANKNLYGNEDDNKGSLCTNRKESSVEFSDPKHYSQTVYLGEKPANDHIFVPKSAYYCEDEAERRDFSLFYDIWLYIGPTPFVELRNVKLYMIDNAFGLVQDEQDKFVCESAHGAFIYHGDHFTKRTDNGDIVINYQHSQIRTAQNFSMSGPFLLPFRLAGTYYYHFVNETLAIASEVQDSKWSGKILMASNQSFFTRMTKATYDAGFDTIFGADSDRTLKLDKGIYHFSSLMVPKQWEYGLAAHSNLSEKLRLGAADVGSYDYIYITRRNAGDRRVKNEDKLLIELERFYPGIAVLELEKLSFSEQITIFEGAQVIIGPHGSGFTNLIFCKSGATVIEIHPYHSTPAFGHLSFIKSLKYIAYIPEDHKNQNDDFLVNLVSFRRFLEWFVPTSRSSARTFDR